MQKAQSSKNTTNYKRRCVEKKDPIRSSNERMIRKKYDTTGKNNAVSRTVNTAITEKNTRLIDRKDAPF